MEAKILACRATWLPEKACKGLAVSVTARYNAWLSVKGEFRAIS